MGDFVAIACLGLPMPGIVPGLGWLVDVIVLYAIARAVFTQSKAKK